ncbi:MAG: AMP-dependent synthetase [Bacillus thermozeamaize]|uniref:acetate--CoA ligase n=1 Tax=Bacillus thermozeamaize TaxID=230954 RepID=A0A1Y3PEU9_9BACI|nr:MAG: AMP-dependent synthetase [Bacillus thermozeamaize]
MLGGVISVNQAVWYPTKERVESTRLYQWMKRLGFEDYDRFHQASVRDIAWFWGEAEKELGIAWFQPYRQVLDLSRGPQWPRWFVGGKLNLAYNVLDKWLEDPQVRRRNALIYEREDGVIRRYTYEALAGWVNRVAAGLKRQGVQKGDRIGIYLPMIPEAAVIMLAVAKIGAIFIPSFSGFAADPVAKRLQSSGARMLVTADGFIRRGKVVPMKEEADKAVALSPTIEKVVVVRSLGREIPWNQDKDIDWKELEAEKEAEREEVSCEVLDSDTPFMLLYTSGTKPKGTVHIHAGFPIRAAFEAGLQLDLRPGEVMFWVTDMGWVVGPLVLLGSLMNAATLVMYDGSPDFPAPDRIWQMAERHQVSILGVAPTLIRAMVPHGEELAGRHDLSSLKAFASTGEPWNPEPWNWLFEKVGKKRLPILNVSGGTEVSGVIIGTTVLKPIAPTCFNAPNLGMDVDVLDQEGKPVYGQIGELVVRQPWVGMTHGFWQEPERYEETYWSRWKNIWVHGDAVIRDEQGFWTIIGRSDDTLNVAGKRMGPSEMESILVSHPAVREAATIGVPDPLKGEVPVCFAVINPGHAPDESLAEKLMQMVTEQIGKALRPKAIHFVAELPKTRSAKIMHRVIRAVYLGKNPGDLSALDNPESIREIQKFTHE